MGRMGTFLKLALQTCKSLKRPQAAKLRPLFYTECFIIYQNAHGSNISWFAVVTIPCSARLFLSLVTFIIIRLQNPFYNLQFFQFMLPSQNTRMHFGSSVSMYIYLKKATVTTFTCAIQGILKNICNIYFIHNSDVNRNLRVKTFLHFSSAISLVQRY